MSGLTMPRLLECEHAGWRALCESRGGEFYGGLMSGDGLMVLVDGSVLDRDAVVASLDGAPPWASYEISDPRLVPLGPEAAALVYRASAERSGGGPFTAHMSSVYRVVGGALRLALYQQTAVVEPG